MKTDEAGGEQREETTGEMLREEAGGEQRDVASIEEMQRQEE